MRSFIGLGSNLGDRLATLRGAALALAEHGQIVGRSRVFESAPVGGPPQPSYLNAAVALESALDPPALLAVCQRIEAQFGRDRGREVRFGARTLDLDLLLLGGRGELLVDEPDLVVPHPRLHERAFALRPLLDLDPALLHPRLGLPLAALAATLDQSVTPLDPAL